MLFCKANVLSEWYFWVQSTKMVSADNDFSCEDTVSFECSFGSDIFLIFSRAGVWLIQKSQKPTIFEEKED